MVDELYKLVSSSFNDRPGFVEKKTAGEFGIYSGISQNKFFANFYYFNIYFKIFYPKPK